MILNCDLDGVLFDLWAPFCESWGVDRPTRWEGFLDWHWTQDEFDARLGFAAINGLWNFPEHIDPKGIETLNSAVRAGHTVRIVTNKTLITPEATLAARVDTLLMLHAAGLERFTLVFSENSKRGHQADIVIDDHPHVAGWAQPGAVNMLWSQPWNQREMLNGPVRPIIRVSDWETVAEFISERSVGV